MDGLAGGKKLRRMMGDRSLRVFLTPVRTRLSLRSCQIFLIELFIWVFWVLVAAHGLFLEVVASRGYSSLWCIGFLLQWPLLLGSTGSSVGSVVVVHGLNCPGIFPDEGLNPCRLHWQVDS